MINLQPFDQPNVESAKVAARAMMKEYNESGKLPDMKAVMESEGIKIYGDIKANNLTEALTSFLSDCEKGKSYVTIQAYLKPDDKLWQTLQSFRLKILKKYNVATTLGYGPRFLHSIGQLHKGDGGNGIFIQLISDYSNEAAILIMREKRNPTFLSAH